MPIESVREGGTLIAKAEARIDGANAKAFQDELESVIDQDDHAVILDLENLFYISSAGLRVILLTAKALQRQETDQVSSGQVRGRSSRVRSGQIRGS